MPDYSVKYGPDNPHPLSTRKTELVWEGKYDEFGNRREVNIADPDLDRDLRRNITDFMKAWKKFSFKGVRIWKSTKK